MSGVALSNPSIIINGETMEIIPNSLTYKGGRLETKVRAVTSGVKTQTVHSENAETAISEVKFKVATTNIVDEEIDDFKSLIASNEISFYQLIQGEIVTRQFSGMSLINDPELGVSSDGSVELIFQGDPMK